MASTSVTIRMDVALKKQAETLFGDLGMSMSTAVIVFAKAAVRQQGMPFELSLDPFYSASNMAHIHRSLADTRPGIVKTLSELEELENE